MTWTLLEILGIVALVAVPVLGVSALLRWWHRPRPLTPLRPDQLDRGERTRQVLADRERGAA